MHQLGKYGVRISREKRFYLVREAYVKYESEQVGDSPEAVAEIFRKVFKLGEQAQEVICMITLDSARRVTGAFEVTRGTLNQSLVHPREIFQRAIFMGAASIILAHNHPSGSRCISDSDVEVTRKIKSAGDIMGIPLDDHLVITAEDFSSMALANLM